MGTIPVGNYGYGAGTAPVQNTRIGNPGDPVGRALVGVGQQITQIGEQRDAEADALARVRAANALSAHEIDLAKARQQFDEEVRTGVVPFEQAEAEWSTRAGKLKPMKPPAGLDPEAMLRYDAQIRQQGERATLGVRDVAMDARRAAFRSEAQQAIDGFEQQAAITGETEASVARVNAMVNTLRAGGMDEAQAQEIVTNSRRRIWTNEAIGRINGATDIATLQAIDNDLTADDGRYTPHMEPDRRIALSNQVKARIAQIENRQQQDIDRREAKAATAVEGLLNFTMTGIPASPEYVAQTAEIVKGTSQEAAFAQVLETQNIVQNVMRLSPAEQQTFVQQQEARLATNGGTPDQRARVQTLRAAVDANDKLMRESPLVWAERRTGKPVQPLDMASLQSGDTSTLSRTLNDRVATLTALRGRYGPQIKMAPLLPQEVELLTSALRKGTYQDRSNFFGVLSKAMPMDPNGRTAYNAVVAQLAPDNPVVAYAGSLAGKRDSSGKPITLTVEGKAITSEQASQRILRGRDLLFPTTENGGKGTAYPIPPPSKFDAEFRTRVGNAFAPFPDSYGPALESVRAYYAAEAAEAGLTDASDIDVGIMDRAVAAVMGNKVVINTSTVFAPWGMSGEDFEEKLDTQVRQAFASGEAFAEQYDFFGWDWNNTSVGVQDFDVVAAGGGSYRLVDAAGVYVRGKDGSPLTIRVAP